MIKVWFIIACVNGMCYGGTREFDSQISCQDAIMDMIKSTARNHPEMLPSLHAACQEKVKIQAESSPEEPK